FFSALALAAVQTNGQSCDLDLGFIIHACQGLPSEATDFNESIEFMRSVTKSFTIGFDRTRVALIASCYSTNRVEFDLGDGTSKDQVLFDNTLTRMLQEKGNSSNFRLAIAPAFRDARRKIFDQRYGDRREKRNVLIILMNRAIRDMSYVRYATDFLSSPSQEDINVIAVGVNGGTSRTELEVMAGNKPENVFQVSDSSQLSSIANDIGLLSCQDTQTTTTTTTTTTTENETTEPSSTDATDTTTTTTTTTENETTEPSSTDATDTTTTTTTTTENETTEPSSTDATDTTTTTTTTTENETTEPSSTDATDTTIGTTDDTTMETTVVTDTTNATDTTSSTLITIAPSESITSSSQPINLESSIISTMEISENLSTSFYSSTSIDQSENINPSPSTTLPEMTSSIKTTPGPAKTTPSKQSTCDIDLGFVVAESEPVNMGTFSKSMNFVKNIAQHFSLSLDRTRTSLITYSNEAVLQFKFNEQAGHDKRFFNGYLSEIVRKGYGNNTYAALNMARNEMFNSKSGDRPDKKDVLIILLTDERNAKREELISVASSLRESGVKILAVGVGDKVWEDELNIIAGNSMNVFSVSDADSLNELIENIILSTCDERMLELECHSSGFKAGFSLPKLESKSLPYSISFSGNNTCGSINKTSEDHISDGRIWMESNFTDCGIKAYYIGDNIAFEQTIVIEYGSKSLSSVVYRYLTSSHVVKCFLDRKITQKLNINVQDVQEEAPSVNGTSDFEFDLKIMDTSDDENEVQLANIGEPLKFVLNLENAPNQVKTSPQNCYATKTDGTGRYNLIADRCAGADEATAVITSPSNELHSFSWELLAFRYFGESNAVVIVCEVLVCKNEPFLELSDECRRCGQTSNRRKRRNIDGDVIEKKEVISKPFFIINKRQEQPEPDSQQRGFLTTSKGIAVVAGMGGTIVVISGFILKKMFCSAPKVLN
uniref:Uncharacterized protein n=1 Tax=Clytia hemisphaerica TaxID=252671 RepID=A0A7M5WXB5_9CNID